MNSDPQHCPPGTPPPMYWYHTHQVPVPYLPGTPPRYRYRTQPTRYYTHQAPHPLGTGTTITRYRYHTHQVSQSPGTTPTRYHNHQVPHPLGITIIRYPTHQVPVPHPNTLSTGDTPTKYSTRQKMVFGPFFRIWSWRTAHARMTGFYTADTIATIVPRN
jgi:hypothetical protein